MARQICSTRFKRGTCPFKTDRMASLRQTAVDRCPVLGLAIFREPTPDRLREIDGHTGKYTASQDENGA